MSHANLIQLNTEPIMTPLDTNSVLEDPLFLYRYDYVGGEYIGRQRDQAYREIQKIILPFATVNIKNKTLTFKKKEVVKKHFTRLMNKNVRQLKNYLKEEKFIDACCVLQYEILNLNLTNDIFFMDYGMSLVQLVSSYLQGTLPKVLYLGKAIELGY